MSSTKHLDEYYVAGRSVPALANGMATGVDWMSAASFIVSFTYVASQLMGVGIIMSRMVGVDYRVGMFVGWRVC